MKVIIFSLLALGFFVDDVASKPAKLHSHQQSESRKIVGGRPALPGEVPYQLVLVTQYGLLCGASLVEVGGIHIAVTAAHCVDNKSPESLAVGAGLLNLSDSTGMEQGQLVQKVLVHEDFGYNWDAFWNDIAILFMPELFNLTESVATIPLPAKDQLTVNGNLTVSGWGDLEFLGESPEHLQIVEIPIVDTASCMYLYGLVNDSVVCAGTDQGDLTPCHGDGGGPARSDDGYLAGIFSFGTAACGAPESPGVFTRVSAYIDWIENAVNSFKMERIK